MSRLTVYFVLNKASASGLLFVTVNDIGCCLERLHAEIDVSVFFVLLLLPFELLQPANLHLFVYGSNRSAICDQHTGSIL